MRVVLMGVAGCGKSSVGAALATALAIPYRDGDDLHPAANIAKMSRGEALTDADRWPWLALVGEALRAGPMIVGCSALRRVYRERITAAAGGPVCFVHLSGSRAVIEARMRARQGHFMPPALLDSQFKTLEPPEPDENAVTVDIDQPLEKIVAAIQIALAGMEKE
jgi:gluconokinase